MADVNDLVERTLQNLGVLDTGQPISAEDADLIQSRLVGKLAELNARDVGSFDVDNLDDAVLNPLADIMAYECKSAFNVADQSGDLYRRGGKGQEAEQTLKDIIRLRTPRQTMRVEIFGGGRFMGRWR